MVLKNLGLFLLYVFSDLLGGDLIPVPTKYKASNTSAFLDAINENQRGSFKRLLMKTAKGTGCAQIKHIIENQKTVSHDLWRSGLSIANVCTDGDKGAELMSSKHDDYSLSRTLRKMQDTGGRTSVVRSLHITSYVIRVLTTVKYLPLLC